MLWSEESYELVLEEKPKCYIKCFVDGWVSR